MKYYNFSGGAKGSDIAWETVGKKFNVKTIAFSFDGHNSISPNRKILSDEQLLEGWERVLIAAKKMNRYIERSSLYVRKLLSRNWYQVKYSDAIYAIGIIVKPGDKYDKFKNNTNNSIVAGGTGYAVSMGIENNKIVYVFDQNLTDWFKWDYDINDFVKVDTPVLTNKFAGIGTREININGLNAIKKVYDKTFNNVD